MGFFSWKCNCCGKSISNSSSIYGAEPAVFITPFGNFKEYEYEGYGVFDDIDVYAMCAVMMEKATFDKINKKFFINGVETSQDEVRGLAFEDFYKAKSMVKITCMHCFDENMNYENSSVSDKCSDQGYFYFEDEDEDEDEEYYDDN